MNPKHELFCVEYIKTRFNGTQAYMNVYPKASRKTASNRQWELRQREDVQQRIEELKQEFMEEKVMSAEETLAELTSIARGNSIQDGMSVQAQLRALELMAKYHKLLTEKVETENRNENVVINITGLEEDEHED